MGKIRLTESPVLNHAWGSTFYVTPRGLTTSVIHDSRGMRSFSIDFDFIRHVLRMMNSAGETLELPLVAESVASFYGNCLGGLRGLGVEAEICETPNEVVDATPFSKDLRHCHYDPEVARKFFGALLQAERVMQRFRSRFIGKCSPVHFFWGSMDLAVTRFSGRRAPEHPGGVPHLPDLVAKEAYSHEVSSCGFWPGNDQLPDAAFYSYAYPEPEAFKQARVRPEGASYQPMLREFVLPYNWVRNSPRPDEALLDFFQSTYDAAADLGKWDRPSLEESRYLSRLREIHQKKAA